MTNPTVSSSLTPEQVPPELVGVGAEAIQDRARHLGLTWLLRPATVSSYKATDGSATAIYDGDTVALGFTSLVGPLTAGRRVMGLAIPPGGNYILGTYGSVVDPWHTFVFKNGWNNNAGGVPASYRLVRSLNSVQIVGEIIAGTTTLGTIIATLPAAYAPRHRTTFPISVNPAALPAIGPLLQVQTNGDIAIFTSATAGQIVYFTSLYPLDA